jgi:hypothetical protein
MHRRRKRPPSRFSATVPAQGTGNLPSLCQSADITLGC